MAPPSPPAVTVAEESRAHGSRTSFVPRAASAYADDEKTAGGTDSFKVLDAATAASDRWAGVLNGAGYRIEVPKNWNGKLVMCAHG